MFEVPGSCFGNLATFQVAISFDKSPKELITKTNCQQLICHSGRREWSFSSELMESNTGNSLSNEKKPLGHSSPNNEGNKPEEKGKSSSVFVNHAAIAWNESRRKWVGDQSQRLQRVKKDQIISWSTTYEELLSTNEPFSEPIPLPEMVDFLVDIWHDEGLFD